ncbi:MAG: heat shock protein HtpX [Parcubacteria bacterium C7867-003]|nr:MAG: heat shock protein HtpX [Parcubacteria bacterium C7867-003]
MNSLKTTILLASLTGIIVFLGYYLGGQNGALLALLISVVMNFGSYWFSDKIVLSLYKAKEITRESNPSLHEMIEELSQKANLPKPRLYLVDLPVPNAFATGRNENNAVVAVSSGILTLLSKEELRGVLAHELSHIKNKDILISSVAATLAGAISYLSQMAYFSGGLSGDDGNRKGAGFGGLLFLILTPIIATLLNLAVSRSREYMADETGSNISKDPMSLATALKKLGDFSHTHPVQAGPRHEATAHLFIVNPFKSSFLASLFSTHPPTEERIKKLENLKLS